MYTHWEESYAQCGGWEPDERMVECLLSANRKRLHNVTVAFTW